mgnify:CR=1 FL=1
MNFDRYTERAKGFVQSAQSLALREGHQQIAPEHLLKVLLDDDEGMCAGLIARAGGNAKAAQQGVERLLAKRPKVSGGGAGQPSASQEFARLFDQAEKIAKQAGVKALVLTHIVPAVPFTFLNAYYLKGAAAEFDGPITVGQDGMIFSLAAGGSEITNGRLN